MNEYYFILQILTLGASAILALRLGLAALVATGACHLLCCNLFISKQISLFSLSVTASDAFAVSLFLINNLIVIYYGRDKARSAIKTNMLILILFTLVSKIHLLFTPSSFDSLSPMYEAIFAQGIRVTLSSITCFYLSQKLDLTLFTYFSRKFSKVSAMFISLSISQAFDTLAFTYLAFWGLGFAFGQILVFSYAIKLICIFCMSPVTLICKHLIRRKPHEV
jgi:queuosine precursor transporter